MEESAPSEACDKKLKAADTTMLAVAAATVHVVRHGQVDNPNRVFYGRLPGFGLHVDGCEQAKQAGKYLKELVPEASSLLVAASPMLRAQQTAKIIAEVLEIDGVQTEEGVNEVYSPHDGKSMAEMEAINWQIYNYDSVSEFETFDMLCDRVASTLRRLAAAGTHKDIVVVSHGDCCVAARLWGLGRDFSLAERSKLQSEGYPTYCSVSSLQITADGDCLGIEMHQVVAENADGKKS